MSHLDALTRAPILQGLSTAQLAALLDTNQVLTFRRDQIVFEEHSRGRDLYIVLRGAVAIKVDPAKRGVIERGSIELRVLRTLIPGESFGEMAFVGEHPREATIVAVEDDTTLLALSPDMLDDGPQARLILGNIARDLSDKLRGSNARFIAHVLSSYYLTALVEELGADAYDCTPIIPLQKLVVIRDVESFILSGPGRLLPHVPEKEAIELSIFSEPAILRRLAGLGTPSGAVIFNALFSILRSGRISERIDQAHWRYAVAPDAERRTGALVVDKAIEGQAHARPYTLEWQLKGARYHEGTRTSSAHLFLYVHDDEALSTRHQAQQMIATIAMPVQASIAAGLPKWERDALKTRVLIIHHRSHEVARTLQTIQELGYQIDTFIGIPYGDVNWDYITMLDHAAGHNYLSLKLTPHPIEATRYQVDFRQSSFLDTQTERDLGALFGDPRGSADYLTAMQALAEYCLVRALERCRERAERLIVYEDGGYIISMIYALYNDARHRSHALVKAAVDEGMIVGVSEVTVAGERKNVQVIAENGGRALLPVLSNARSDIKAVFEAMGVGEAVIHAASTALGRLGLPTFQSRRVAVLGGNGTIGTRLVEQLTALHNSTANVFAIDLSVRAFAQALDRDTLPYAATRLAYRRLPRYVVADDCVPVILDHPFSDRALHPDRAAIAQAIRAFLADPRSARELAITNSHPLPDADLRWLWQEVAGHSGYRQISAIPLPDDMGVRYHLGDGRAPRVVTLLAASTVLTFDNVARLIHHGADTVVGCTGYAIFSATNLDEFFARPCPEGRVDELTLISASSKDYEFRHAIELLHILLMLQTGAALSADMRLRWFAGFYRDALSFVRDDDFPALQSLLAAPLTDDTVRALRAAAPAVAGAMGLTDDNQACWRELVADFIAHKIRRAVSIRKEIRSDIGSIYHLTVNGHAKRVVLLADGLVVNFFARHEKGVKTEYIDPVVTMQVLSLVKLSTTSIAPGLYKMDAYLRPEDLATFWAAIDDYCRPLSLRDGGGA